MTVLVDGEPRVATGTLSDISDEPTILTVVSGEPVVDIVLNLDLPLDAISVQGVVLAAVEFKGDNLFVEDADGGLFEVLVQGANLETFGSDSFSDITQIREGDTVSSDGALLGSDQVRANLIKADIVLSPT